MVVFPNGKPRKESDWGVCGLFSCSAFGVATFCRDWASVERSWSPAVGWCQRRRVQAWVPSCFCSAVSVACSSCARKVEVVLPSMVSVRVLGWVWARVEARPSQAARSGRVKVSFAATTAQPPETGRTAPATPRASALKSASTRTGILRRPRPTPPVCGGGESDAEECGVECAGGGCCEEENR